MRKKEREREPTHIIQNSWLTQNIVLLVKSLRVLISGSHSRICRLTFANATRLWKNNKSVNSRLHHPAPVCMYCTYVVCPSQSKKEDVYMLPGLEFWTLLITSDNLNKFGRFENFCGRKNDLFRCWRKPYKRPTWMTTQVEASTWQPGQPLHQGNLSIQTLWPTTRHSIILDFHSPSSCKKLPNNL